MAPPEWAQWLAMDDDGDWYWYELEPEAGLTGWNRPIIHGQREGFMQLAECVATPWKTTKESR